MTAHPFWPVSAVFAGPAGGTGQVHSPRSACDEALIQLVAGLGSPIYRTREAAARKLLEAGEVALPVLRKGAESAGVEGRRRCEQLIVQITRRAEDDRARKVVAKVEARWRKGQVRPFLRRLVHEPQFATAEHIREAWELSEYVVAKACLVSGKRFRLPPLDYAKFPVLRDSAQLRYKDIGFFHHIGLFHGLFKGPRNQPPCRQSFVICAGPMDANIEECVVFIDGDLAPCRAISRSVVVCLGGIGQHGKVRASVILATGRFDGVIMAEDSFFQVAKLGECIRSQNSVYLGLNNVHATRSSGDLFLDGPGPLDLFRDRRQTSP